MSLLRMGILAGVCTLPVFHASASPAGDSVAKTFDENTFFAKEEEKIKRSVPGSVARGYWVSLRSQGAFYNSTLESVLGRAGAEVSVGYRTGKLGYFIETGYDHFWDVSQSTAQLNTMKIALGVDWLHSGGHLSSQFSAGFSRLLRATAIHKAGHWGLYYKIKPLSLRFKWKNNLDVEFSPLYADDIIIDTGAFMSTLTQVMTGAGLIWHF